MDLKAQETLRREAGRKVRVTVQPLHGNAQPHFHVECRLSAATVSSEVIKQLVNRETTGKPVETDVVHFNTFNTATWRYPNAT